METLDIKGLIEKHPKAGRVIIDGVMEFVKGLQQSMIDDLSSEERKSVMEDVPEIGEKDIMEFLEVTVSNSGNLQLLIDIFDINRIYVCPAYDGEWRVWISSKDEQTYVEDGATNRKDAYVKAFPVAFEIFEEQLKNKEDGTSDKS